MPGDFNNLTANKPFIEGSWVTKRNGTYYWQYAAPGTQYKTYADGIFTAASPTGPWTYAAQYSPVSHKPTGFLGGVGHSSTFDDFAGQTWHISTASIDVRDATCGHFERRAALHPVLWGEHGEMVVDTYLGDYPQYASGTGSPGWMLLSYNKTTNASSSLSGHSTALAVNEDIRTWWSASNDNAGEWFQIDLGAACDIHAVQTNFADQDANHNGILTASYRYTLAVSTDGVTWRTVLSRGPPPALAAPPFMVEGSCAAANYSKLCLHNAKPILRSFESVDPGECCRNCTAEPKCISWNVNMNMKQCFLRASYVANPGTGCISGQSRAVPPPPPPAPDQPHDYAELAGPARARHVRITSHFMPAGGKFSLSGLRVFGLCPGALPAAAISVRAVRDSNDPRRAHVSWLAGGPGVLAEFYIVRYGAAKDRLFGNYQVYGGTNLTVANLNAGTSYFVTVDSVGSTGVAEGVAVVQV